MVEDLLSHGLLCGSPEPCDEIMALEIRWLMRECHKYNIIRDVKELDRKEVSDGPQYMAICQLHGR